MSSFIHFWGCVLKFGLMVCGTCDVTLSIIIELFYILQDSFYHNLNEEELTRVQDYNFDHPGKFNCSHQSHYLWLSLDIKILYGIKYAPASSEWFFPFISILFYV